MMFCRETSQLQTSPPPTSKRTYDVSRGQNRYVRLPLYSTQPYGIAIGDSSFSFDSKTNCFAAFNGCKTFKMDKNLVFSTFDF